MEKSNTSFHGGDTFANTVRSPVSIVTQRAERATVLSDVFDVSTPVVHCPTSGDGLRVRIDVRPVNSDTQRMASPAAPKNAKPGVVPTARQRGIGFEATMEKYTMRWNSMFLVRICVLRFGRKLHSWSIYRNSHNPLPPKMFLAEAS